MVKNHLNRIAAPKNWSFGRRENRWTARSSPGPHSIKNCITQNYILKEILNYASTTRESKKILNANDVKIDGKARKNFRFPVGIFDTIEFTSTNEFFRIVLNKKGKLGIIKIKKEEALLKPCKIIGKTMVRGKLQLNLFDGKNILADDKAYKVGDTLLLVLPQDKISKHLKLGKNSTIFLAGGKHIGKIGNVENIVEDKVIYKDSKGDLIETSKKYAFVVGDSKMSITLG